MTKGNNVYGLNDPKSPNYIADMNDRIRVLAEIHTVAASLGVTAASFAASAGVKA